MTIDLLNGSWHENLTLIQNSLCKEGDVYFWEISCFRNEILIARLSVPVKSEWSQHFDMARRSNDYGGLRMNIGLIGSCGGKSCEAERRLQLW